MSYRIGLLVAAVIAILAIPASASAATMKFQGKAVGAKPNPDMRVTFDVTSSKGKPAAISNVEVTNAQYFCQNGAETVRDVPMFTTGGFGKGNKFDVRETNPPPGFDNWIYGKFFYPKKGKFKKPTIKGSFTSEFGYSPTSFDEYNCLTFEDFVATPVKK
jgi:hypothetical protein